MYHAPEINNFKDNGTTVSHHQGLQAGPSLAVIGRVSEMEKIAERIEKIPSLAYMRGSITIYAIADDEAVGAVPDADNVLILLDAMELCSAKPVAALYWKVLARAASLGIIAGRGVPHNPKPITWH